jgi:hypothetical protein
MRGISQASMKVASSLGLAAGPMEALPGLGVAGGITATAAAVASLGAHWGPTGYEISRTPQLIGVSTNDLQRYRGAAQLAGVSQEALTNSFASLGRTMQDAQFGRNPEAYAVLNKLGIGIQRNAQGVVDTVGTFNDLALAISRITDPHVQEKMADIFGLREALPLLRQGPDAIARLTQEAEKFGLVAGGEALRPLASDPLSRAERFAQAQQLVARRHRVDVVAEQNEVVQLAAAVGDMLGEQRLRPEAHLLEHRDRGALIGSHLRDQLLQA